MHRCVKTHTHTRMHAHTHTHTHTHTHNITWFGTHPTTHTHTYIKHTKTQRVSAGETADSDVFSNVALSAEVLLYP